MMRSLNMYRIQCVAPNMAVSRKKVGTAIYLNSEANSFKGLGFNIGKDGPKIYKKTINKLALYTSTQFKNGSDVVVCLWLEE